MTIHEMRATGTVLDRILARTATDLARRKAAVPIDVVERLAAERREVPSLSRSLAGYGLSMIAEVKRASPSRGSFPVEIEAHEVAAEYMRGGAVAISCLTDEPFFRGSLADLRDVAEVAHERAEPVPVLRKDFVIDRYQVVEAKAHGADAILLIAAAMGDGDLRHLRECAESIGLEAFVEVHDEGELERALDSGARLIGINNRDLRTFHVDLAVTERLAPMIPTGKVVVGESGIFTRDDMRRMASAGVHAVLVGEALVMQPDRALAVRRLLGAG